MMGIGFDEFIVPLEDSAIRTYLRFSQLRANMFRFLNQIPVLFAEGFHIL